MNDAQPIRGLLAAYRSGAQAPVEVLRAAHARAEAYPQPVWISLLDWDAIAGYLERLTGPEQPLYGVPFAIKDNIDLAGTLTTAACPVFGYLPVRSAFVVERLVAAGAIPFGKTNLDQFATGLTGTRTPYGECHSLGDERYIAGGSSSGSAIAVAAGLVSFALGTDTAGSGRVPAACNGIVGVKPSAGHLSTSGVVAACRTLDCVSIFAADVADARAVLDVARAPDPADPFSRASAGRDASIPSGARLGVPKRGQLNFHGDVTAATAWEAALVLAGERGFTAVEVDIRPYVAAGRLLYDGPWVAERAAAVGDFAAAHPRDVDPIVREILAAGARPSAVEAFRGVYELAGLRRETAGDWERVDALMLPTTPTTFTREEAAADPRRASAILGTYTNFVNLLGLCAVAAPGPRRADGLACGISLIGPWGADEHLLDLAARWLGEDVEHAPVAPLARVAVCGAHMSGLPLHGALTAVGARLEAVRRTAPAYRLYALAGTDPPKPGLVRGDDGAEIELEVYAIPPEGLGRLACQVRPPLSIGAVELDDGSTVAGFVCDSAVAATARDITEWGGWRAFLGRREPVRAP